jgi:hypothetical protein
LTTLNSSTDLAPVALQLHTKMQRLVLKYQKKA